MPLACRPVIAQLLDYLRANSQYDVDAAVAARSVVLVSLIADVTCAYDAAQSRRPLWVLVVSFASILPYLGHVRFGGGIGSAGWEQDVMLQLPIFHCAEILFNQALSLGRRDTTSSRQTTSLYSVQAELSGAAISAA
jgi:hypothetical protein